MKTDMMRCLRCKGRKKLYKKMNNYSYIDTGGSLVDCPLCLGAGEIKSIENVLENSSLERKSSDEKKRTYRKKEK